MCERNVHGSKQIQDLENGVSQLASATSPRNKFDHIGNDHMLLYPIVRAWLGLVDKREHPRDLESLALLSCRRTDLTGRPSSTCSQRAVVMTQPCGETDGQGIGEIVLKLSNISGNESSAGLSASRPPCHHASIPLCLSPLFQIFRHFWNPWRLSVNPEMPGVATQAHQSSLNFDRQVDLTYFQYELGECNASRQLLSALDIGDY